MNKYIIAMGALAFTVAGSLYADTGTVKPKAVTKAPAPVVAGPVDRQLEIRAGPRGSFLTGDIRQGKNGTTLDVWNDLGIDEPSLGVQVDIDWQPIKRWHFDFGFQWDDYDHSGTTSKNILTDKGDLILSGARVNVDANIYTFEGKFGYDLIKNNTYRLQPYIGGKGVKLEAKANASGTVQTAAPGSTTVTGTRTLTPYDEAYGTFFGGIDQRLYISRDWYVGGDIGAFGLDTWYYLTGDAYTGYDFSKNWGVRLGYAYDYLDHENTNKSVKASPLLGAIYLQAVWGF